MTIFRLLLPTSSICTGVGYVNASLISIAKNYFTVYLSIYPFITQLTEICHVFMMNSVNMNAYKIFYIDIIFDILGLD